MGTRGYPRLGWISYDYEMIRLYDAFWVIISQINDGNNIITVSMMVLWKVSFSILDSKNDCY